jgi:hypothetical protein
MLSKHVSVILTKLLTGHFLHAAQRLNVLYSSRRRQLGFL